MNELEEQMVNEIEDAIFKMAKLHSTDQKHKDNEEYIIHFIGVDEDELKQLISYPLYHSYQSC